jgi:radical SAM superfamily enzyme YgiQ (UPF0313 family)
MEQNSRQRPWYSGDMQVELISPASEDSTYLPRYGLGILAAQTPRDIEVIYTDDVIRRIDLDRDVKDVDLVGISVDSKTAKRSYDIADAYRRRGVKVVLGGIHPTALPDEAGAHADCVVVGEADTVWRTVLDDFQRDELAPVYRPPLPDLADMPIARRDLFRSIKYIPYQVVQTMRGCPYPCEFCSVSTQSGKTFRFRPVENVLAELERLDRMILFADDNIMINREESEPLFRGMVPLKKHWIGQCSLAAVEKIDHVKLMADSGCKALFIGFESVDQETVRHTSKPQNKVSRYLDIVAGLRDHGIAVWGSFVFGFDTDDTSVFDRTVEAAIDMKMTMASFALLTPYPGTRLYERLQEEERLTDPTWWLGEDHDAGSPYYRPAKMSRTELCEGWARAWRSFYTARSMWRRFTLKGAFNPIQAVGFWPLNVMQHRLAHSKITDGVQRHRTR